MSSHSFNLTEKQETALGTIASRTGRTKVDVIKEQVTYYFKKMLEDESKSAKNIITDEPLTDAQQAELNAIVLNAENEYLATL